jgi:monofunctional biosynthetic peptidoglycan transglycosylase
MGKKIRDYRGMQINKKKCVRYLKHIAFVFFVLTATSVLLLRWIPPLGSALMVENRITSWFTPGDYTAYYQWVPIEKISPQVAIAVIAAEDQRFAEHLGFDMKAIEKAVAYNGKHRKTKGASTISQQTAKNLFLWSDRSWLRKGFEAYFTVLIETLWSKERILEVYLNIVEFGDGVYGVEAAAQYYFNKSAKNITASEAALLAAVLPNPHRFKIEAPSAHVRGRQAWILQQMGQLGGSQFINRL